MITSKLTTSVFPKEYRLNTPAEFSQVFKKPQKLYAEGLTILYVENGMAYARLGMAIAKKHAKRAVLRNRVRRLIRENFRQHATQLAGFDVVILANRLVKPLELDSWFRELPKKWRLVQKQQEKLHSS